MQPSTARNWWQSLIFSARFHIQKDIAQSSFFVSRAFLLSISTSAVVIGIGLILFFKAIYIDHNPYSDSSMGLLLAVIATSFFVIAAIVYAIKKRFGHNKIVGSLNAFLQWHIYAAIIAVVVAGLHSFGHFELLTGTLAFYSLLLLVLSGLIGRFIDRIVPRMIVKEVTRTITRQGEDVISVVSQRALLENQQLPPPNLHYLVYDTAQAIRRGQNYRLLIRSWRAFHAALGIITLILICWHVLFAMQILFASRG